MSVSDSARIAADALAKAQAEAARGGWPARPMCSLPNRKTLWAWTIATFFGAGLGKPGPGTWGSIAATLLYAAAAYFLNPTAAQLALWTLAAAILATAIGVPAATIAARESGRKDPGFVVIDEVAGVWITLTAIFWAKPDWQHILAALILFRIFDITKPFPVRNLEKLPEGWGIVFDDVAAGLYAGAVLLLLNRFI
jgi:phosphatidylglycerophosphatase A